MKIKDLKEIIEADIKTWSVRMTEKYNWLTIRYEYNDKHKCFLVSFYGTNLDDIDFCKDAFGFGDDVAEKYDDDNVLFCDSEELFKLSENAIYVGKELKKGVGK